MFRRKEEDELENEQLDFGNDNSASEAEAPQASRSNASESAANASSRSEESSSRPAAPASAPAEAAAKPAPSPRPAAAAAAANFRPQPAPNPAAAHASRAATPAVSETRTPSPVSASANSKRILTVGNDIHMKGEINSCDRLVIEGIVDATLKDVHTVELAETGSLRGTAEVQDAEISGYFEGDLTVTGRLVVYSTGTIKGSVTYGEIEIERGGQISGSVAQGGDAATSNRKAKKAA